MSKNSSAPSTSNCNGVETTCAAFINDKGRVVLRHVNEYLASRGCKTMESRKNSASEQRCADAESSSLHLDTKYYTCDLPVWSFVSFESFAEKLSQQPELSFAALLVCASRRELNEDFLARLSQLSKLGSVDVKTLILKDWNCSPSEDTPINYSVDYTKLRKFAIARGIEIIHVEKDLGLKDRGGSKDSDGGVDENVENEQNNEEEEEEEEGSEFGATGIARLVEALETFRWPGLKLKPNPIVGSEHRRQLRDYILAEIDSERSMRAKSKECASDKTNNLDNRGRGGVEVKEEKTFKTFSSLSLASSFPPSDYPDSEDEEAILGWFDRPLERENFQLHVEMENLFPDLKFQKFSNC